MVSLVSLPNFLFWAGVTSVILKNVVETVGSCLADNIFSEVHWIMKSSSSIMFVVDGNGFSTVTMPLLENLFKSCYEALVGLELSVGVLIEHRDHVFIWREL